MEKRKMKTLLSLLLVIFAVYLIGVEALAAGKVKAVGIMTSIEEDGSVIIDENGYDVDPKVRVLDYEGNLISLNDLSLPVRIDFEYEYTKKGPVIKLIREYPEDVPQ